MRLWFARFIGAAAAFLCSLALWPGFRHVNAAFDVDASYMGNNICLASGSTTLSVVMVSSSGHRYDRTVALMNSRPRPK